MSENASLLLILVASLAVVFCAVCAIVLCDEWRTNMVQRFKRRHNRTRIEQILRSQGLCPQRTDNDMQLAFVKDKTVYSVVYNDAHFVISVMYAGIQANEVCCQWASYHTMTQTPFVKIRVESSAEHDGETPSEKSQDIIIYVEGVYHSIKDIAKAFPIYFRYLTEAAQMVNVAIERQNEHDDKTLARRQYVYNIEYHFLVGMVDAVTDGKLPAAALADEMWLRQNIQKECPPEYVLLWEENFRIERIDNLGDYRLIVYAFPEPVFVPEAVYGAVLVNVKTNHADYYTLELSFNNRWVLGSMSNSKHANYGSIDSPDLAKFLEWVFSANKHLCAYIDCTDRPANGEMVS